MVCDAWDYSNSASRLCVSEVNFVVCVLAECRYGYRPWTDAAPSAKPWLSKYLAKAADTATDSSSSSRFSKPSWGAASTADEEDDIIKEDEYFSPLNTDADWPESTSNAAAAAAAGAGGGDAAEPLLLHCREVVLLRPRKAPVRVVAPLPRSMRDLLHAMDWR
jgi:hypothetical protein